MSNVPEDPKGEGINEEQNKQHDDELLPVPAPQHKKGDPIDPSVEWEGVEEIDASDLDFSALNELDMLNVLQDEEQDARKKKRAAIEMQGLIAIKSLLNGADPIDVGKRCGFDITDPDYKHERRPSGVPKEMLEQMGWEPNGNRAKFLGWLCHNFTSVIQKQLHEIDKQNGND